MLSRASTTGVVIREADRGAFLMNVSGDLGHRVASVGAVERRGSQVGLDVGVDKNVPAIVERSGLSAGCCQWRWLETSVGDFFERCEVGPTRTLAALSSRPSARCAAPPGMTRTAAASTRRGSRCPPRRPGERIGDRRDHDANDGHDHRTGASPAARGRATTAGGRTGLRRPAPRRSPAVAPALASECRRWPAQP